MMNMDEECDLINLESRNDERNAAFIVLREARLLENVYDRKIEVDYPKHLEQVTFYLYN